MSVDARGGSPIGPGSPGSTGCSPDTAVPGPGGLESCSAGDGAAVGSRGVDLADPLIECGDGVDEPDVETNGDVRGLEIGVPMLVGDDRRGPRSTLGPKHQGFRRPGLEQVGTSCSQRHDISSIAIERRSDEQQIDDVTSPVVDRVGR